MQTISPTISVIIPMYNVQEYIECCARSLFEQSQKDIEFIFIDDVSSDSTLSILEKTLVSYPERKDFVRIIRNDKNKGVAAVRNIGLKAAKGEYIGWVDSDDWIESEMYYDLYQRAIQNNSDIVWCDYYNSFSDHEEWKKQVCKPNSLDYIKALLLGILHGGLCFTLIKRSLFQCNSIFFPEGKNVMEDKIVLIKLAYFAQRISYIPVPYYHYIKYNSNSITNSWAIDLEIERIAQVNLEGIFTFLLNSDLGCDFTKYIAYAKLIFKKEYLNNPNMDCYLKWKELYKEANSFVLACPNTTLKQKILGWLINHNYYLLVKLWIKLKSNKDE